MTACWQPLLKKCRSLAMPAALALLQTLSACVTLRQDVSRVSSQAITDGVRTRVGRVFALPALEHPGLSGFRIIAAGREAFVARAALAVSAERTLDLQYYSVADDLTTELLLSRIVAAAERGVRVRILLDDIHSYARAFSLRAIAAHVGTQVRLFNPFAWAGTSTLGRLVATSPLRMCRSVPKIVVLVALMIASLGTWTVGLGRSSRVFCCRPR